MPDIITPIVGSKWRGEQAAETLRALRHDLAVRLVRENHPKDANAVQVWALGCWVGYLSRIVNEPIARALDAERPVSAFVVELAQFYPSGKLKREPMLKVSW